MEIWRQQDNIPQVYLKPGELCMSERPIRVTTVLGSCVSATFYHRATGLACICHVMQPRCANATLYPDRCPPECKHRYRYAICAIRSMSTKMADLGVRPRELEIKLFGGAALIGHRQAAIPANSIGQLNVQAAMETINRCHLMLKVADVGGTFGRKIIFDTGTGEVLMKRLHNADAHR